ncbi:hypothetical protein DUNSADRAFT_6606 [Dunaliella salina]|uniref:Uncharacterized protein n=1 Tax=Dunaliella salina TaxID=3046 RepID=A0ABQ7GN07_DUNSA|nr:hypothetical protein DUNSADRAFT_6606 [Dunaliella salina]|eukprot:KAF5835990.1 hypothetical protein DUNSADRAFT_6606 [Dunaliella salina]
MPQPAAIFHRNKQYKDAESIYRSILQQDPKHGESHHLLGALLLDLHGLSRFEEAKGHLLSAISCCPKNSKYRQSLGVAYQRKGDKLEAVECLERANEKDPMNVQILMQLGRLLKDAGRPHRAVEVYRSVTLLEPDHPMAHYRAAALLRTLGKYEQSLVHFRQHLRLFPDHAEAKFWIAALSGDSHAAEAPPPRCIASLFDQYSDYFDQHLVTQLEYRTPQLLMDALLSAASAEALSPPWTRCVDLGVGTGLMGPLLRPHVKPNGLEGVDLSAGMIAKAKAEGRGYDRLKVVELVQYLQEAAAQMGGTGMPEDEAVSQKPEGKGLYECVVAADVFVYLGDLRPAFAAAAAVSRKRALFAFSVEAGEDHSSKSKQSTTGAEVLACGGQQQQQQQSQPYSLLPTGRYVHTAQYLRDALNDTGWHVCVLQGGTLRNNGGKPVRGHMCVAART